MNIQILQTFRILIQFINFFPVVNFYLIFRENQGVEQQQITVIGIICFIHMSVLYFNIILLIADIYQVMSKVSSPNPRGQQFQSRHDVKELTNISKSLFDEFHVYQLQASRLSKVSAFVQLMAEINSFNQELQKWKKNQHQIKNLTVTYHLYQNLFSRLMYISNFCKNQEQSLAAVHKTMQWFNIQKPKLRCLVKEITATMKSADQDIKEKDKIDKLLQSTAVKRELQPYQFMSRTAHPGLFPPKERLKDYKRKQFLPFSANQNQENPITSKKSTSASILSKNRLAKFRMSVGTLMTTSASMRQTRQNFKNTVSQFKIQKIVQEKKGEGQAQKDKQVGEIKDPQQKIGEEQLDDLQRQKKVQKQQILQQNIVQKLGQEDAPDGEEENIYEDQQVKNPKKLFVVDHDPQEIEYAKQLIKQNQQSTLRRVMKINEQKIRSKLEDLDLKRNMMIWSKVKGKTNNQQSKKIQKYLHNNRYGQLAFKKKSLYQAQESHDPINHKMVMSSTTGFTDLKTTKQPTVVPMLYRSKSSHPAAMETQIQRLKISQAYRTYGRYINHLPAPSTPEQTPEQGSEKKKRYEQNRAPPQIRSMSLTNLTSMAKKKHFSNILSNNNPNSYNEQVQEQIMRIKTSLTKKGASVEKGSIYKALSAVPPVEIQDGIGFYTAGRDLLSNPFFPKNIGKKKKKK